MKVCVPSLGKRGLEERVGEHFGRVPFYTIYDTETGKVEVIENTSQHMGGTGYPAEIISRKGVEVMLCKGIGRRAIQMFEEFGVMVF
ncbi:MAG TPA: dinitrogenase iron-molybdenum cofactor biosynthesis protein, partial [Thermoplasmata archaeon]|nr:dinitrogenase iron-molybdenum cofactor biosynthesis protein [Thermoplasmata archaeon]